MAMSIENSPRIYHHARRVHFPGHDALCLNLHPALGKYDPIKSPTNHNPVAFNLSFHLGIFTEDNRLLRNYIALHVAINAKGPFQLERAFQRHALIDKSCPLFGSSAA